MDKIIIELSNIGKLNLEKQEWTLQDKFRRMEAKYNKKIRETLQERFNLFRNRNSFLILSRQRNQDLRKTKLISIFNDGMSGDCYDLRLLELLFERPITPQNNMMNLNKKLHHFLMMNRQFA